MKREEFRSYREFRSCRDFRSYREFRSSDNSLLPCKVYRKGSSSGLMSELP